MKTTKDSSLLYEFYVSVSRRLSHPMRAFDDRVMYCSEFHSRFKPRGPVIPNIIGAPVLGQAKPAMAEKRKMLTRTQRQEGAPVRGRPRRKRNARNTYANPHPQPAGGQPTPNSTPEQTLQPVRRLSKKEVSLSTCNSNRH